jgi:hypothetical protein
LSRSSRLPAEIKFFGRYKAGFIRDGVLLAIEHEEPARAPAGAARAWGCDAEWLSLLSILKYRSYDPCTNRWI